MALLKPTVACVLHTLRITTSCPALLWLNPFNEPDGGLLQH